MMWAFHQTTLCPRIPFCRIFVHLLITCVNSGIEIPLSQHCKILQYKIIWQLPMEVQDFFYLCKIYHPAWIQVDRRNVEQSELWLFRPLYHKTGKHAFRSEIILWQILFRVFIEPSTNQDWSKCIFLLIQTKRKLLSMMKSTNYSWIRCWTPPSSGRIGKRLGRRKQIWKSRLTKF